MTNGTRWLTRTRGLVLDTTTHFVAPDAADVALALVVIAGLSVTIAPSLKSWVRGESGQVS